MSYELLPEKPDTFTASLTKPTVTYLQNCLIDDMSIETFRTFMSDELSLKKKPEEKQFLNDLIIHLSETTYLDTIAAFIKENVHMTVCFLGTWCDPLIFDQFIHTNKFIDKILDVPCQLGNKCKFCKGFDMIIPHESTKALQKIGKKFGVCEAGNIRSSKSFQSVLGIDHRSSYKTIVDIWTRTPYKIQRIIQFEQKYHINLFDKRFVQLVEECISTFTFTSIRIKKVGLGNPDIYCASL